jgi:hypothetical protein
VVDKSRLVLRNRWLNALGLLIAAITPSDLRSIESFAKRCFSSCTSYYTCLYDSSIGGYH